MEKLSPPSPSESASRVRLTISVTPEVHATFERMAKASGQSISRSMGDWLHDTVEAAEYMTTLMEKARAAPRQVMREVHSYALGLADETGSLLERLREQGPGRRRTEAASAAPGAAALAPPSCNTGGKGPRTVRKSKGGTR